MMTMQVMSVPSGSASVVGASNSSNLTTQQPGTKKKKEVHAENQDVEKKKVHAEVLNSEVREIPPLLAHWPSPLQPCRLAT
jgi:hypothetical protein